MYQYTDSGLDNVFLVNGFTKKDTPYGEAVAIEDIDGLHRAIARWLINEPRPLTGVELRFLRHELDLSQKSLSAMMGMSEQAVRRWEKDAHKPISNPMADRMVRIIYREFTDGADGTGSVRALIEKLAAADQAAPRPCHLEEADGRWKIAA